MLDLTFVLIVFFTNGITLEITRLQDLSNGLKDSTMEKVGSLKASCLEADGQLGKLREHLIQYEGIIQDCHMSLEQWHSERGNIHPISGLNVICIS